VLKLRTYSEVQEQNGCSCAVHSLASAMSWLVLQPKEDNPSTWCAQDCCLYLEMLLLQSWRCTVAFVKHVYVCQSVRDSIGACTCAAARECKQALFL